MTRMRSLAVFVALLVLAPLARADFREYKEIPVDPAIETKLRHVADDVLKDFPKLTADNLAISVVDVTNPSTVGRGDYHGDANFYPASVVKLFYMVETYKRVKITPEIERALKEMITVSDNDATAFLIDVISDTCSGNNLEGRALNKFIEKRRITNKDFARLGYDISAMAKAWSFGPFGRDVQLLGPNRENRNRMSANSVASLMLWIERRRALSPELSQKMMDLLARPLNPPRKDENQVSEFFGAALPEGSLLWSKAGWTSEVRHDAAYVELPGGKKMVIVIFTRGAADDVTLIPAIGRKVLAELAPR